MRTISRADVKRWGKLITLTFEGDGFLYKMVRLLTGTLARVAQGKAGPEMIQELLAAKNKKKTQFAAPPVLMVAGPWELSIPIMLTHFGWKAAIGILITNTIYFLIFRREFAGMAARAAADTAQEQAPADDPNIPAVVTAVHLAFLAWTVFTLHHPALVVFGFLFFLAFKLATMHHQDELNIRGPMLVGFFLAALVTHGGLQGWWIQPILGGLGKLPLFLGSVVLTAFNDNAAVTYLASMAPTLDHQLAADAVQARALQYAVLTGAVTGGGLTVIANAPNPTGRPSSASISNTASARAASARCSNNDVPYGLLRCCGCF